jgi:hypothetical protein
MLELLELDPLGLTIIFSQLLNAGFFGYQSLRAGFQEYYNDPSHARIISP